MRKKTGTIVRTKLGLWQAIITTPDGKRRRLPPFPKGTSEAMAREKAAHYAERAAQMPEAPLPAGETAADKWWAEFFEHRKSKGLTPVRTLYVAHLQSVLDDKHPSEWTVDDCEAVRDSLDAKILAGEWTREDRVYRFGWKRAWNVWAVFTSACKAAARSKNKALRVRRDNPCQGIEPPERGAKKRKQWLYPLEFRKLLACEDVPGRWRILYALAVYLYVRPNELAALQRKDIDLDAGIIDINKAWNFAKKEPKPYPKSAAGVRFVPIEVELRPLLAMLCEGLEPDDRIVLRMPPAEDWAETLRTHLARAGVDRAALFDDSDTVKHITFYDLRATGITWRTLRGDDARIIQRAAGHEKYATTEGYVREAEVFRGRVGDPFPPLPDLNRYTESITEGLSVGKICVPKGIRSVADTGRSRGNRGIFPRSSDRDEAHRLGTCRDASGGLGIRDHDPNREAASVAPDGRSQGPAFGLLAAFVPCRVRSGARAPIRGGRRRQLSAPPGALARGHALARPRPLPAPRAGPQRPALPVPGRA
ncbi:MAG TPA: tyrosine-type recombinase/integrase [Polyangiaceae bacterium]|nr:tyrosine-type recombinase/integrase [Polyangiaceae bacterium]